MTKSDLSLKILEYKKNGFALIENICSDLNDLDIEKLCGENIERFYEKDEVSLRSIYNFQEHNLFKNWLEKQIWIKELVKPIVGDDIYLHKTKINIKNKDTNSIWPYHRDFPFWNVFDNILQNKMINVAVFLDDVYEGSGELVMIPQSQTFFFPKEKQNNTVEYSIDGSASSDLLFDFNKEEIEILQAKFGSENIVGPKGSVLIFDPNVVHGSQHSLENNSRKILILTFNSCENAPTKPSKRPEYLCSKNYTPIQWK